MHRKKYCTSTLYSIFFFCHKCDVYFLPICLQSSYCKDKALDFTSIKVAVLRQTENIIGCVSISSEVSTPCRESDISGAVTLQCVSVSALKCSPESTRKHRKCGTHTKSIQLNVLYQSCSHSSYCLFSYLFWCISILNILLERYIP